MKDFIKDVKPLTVKHTTIGHRKINYLKKKVSIEEIQFVSQKSFLQKLTRKEKRNFIYEKSIDLHGYTRDESFNILIDFFMRCREENIRKVLVITGGNNLRHTTLRKSFQTWVKESFGNLIRSCTLANIQHGGEGAFYVSLKKK